MKKLLSLLLAYVFLQSQTWALSGGPNYNGAGAGASVVGTFAGVLTPTIKNVNTLGVFGVVSPQAGLASGAFVYFASGETFTGVIEGSADPSSLVLSALLDAQANVTQLQNAGNNGTSGTSTLATFPIGFANGTLYATVSAAGDLFGAIERLTGKATLQVQGATATGLPNGAVATILLKVNGFQQTTDTSTTFDLSSFTVNTAGGGGSSATGG
jgi:hypothetical protein